MSKTIRTMALGLVDFASVQWARLKGPATRLCVGFFYIITGLTVRTGRFLGRLGAGLVGWAVRYPRLSLVTALAAPLITVLVPAFWPAPTPHIDLGQSLDCLALNIYHEARGEPQEGKIAVGQVVMNRVQDTAFPSRVCAVIKQGGALPRDRCQFSWWCDGRSDQPEDPAAWKESQSLARQILEGAVGDPTRGALWYHAEQVTPVWKQNLARQGQIGRHIFYIKQSQ